MTQTIAEFLKANCKAGDRVYDNGVEYCVQIWADELMLNPSDGTILTVDQHNWDILKQPSVWRRACITNCDDHLQNKVYETWQRIATYEPVRERKREEIKQAIKRFEQELDELFLKG